MHRLFIGTMLAATALLVSQEHPGQAQKGGPQQKYGWLTSLEQAKAVARQTGKPIFLVFRCEP